MQDRNHAHSQALTRRTLIGGAASGAFLLTLGRWVIPAPVAAVGSPVPATTYVALRDAVSPLDTQGVVSATAEFEAWWRGQDRDMRTHVSRVFEALDRGELGSFARAGRAERASLIDEWTHPSGDPLRSEPLRDCLSAGMGAIAIVHAPLSVPDGRVPVG